MNRNILRTLLIPAFLLEAGMITLLRGEFGNHKSAFIFFCIAALIGLAGIYLSFTTSALILNLYIPAIVSLLLPLTLVLLRKDFRGNFPDKLVSKEGLLSSRTLFFAGFGALLFVPVFKTITHLPPFVGMLFGLGITWLISEYVHPEENFQQENRRLYSVRRALSRIELSSILFFAGILLTIKSLESIAVFHPDGKAVSFLHQVAENLQATIPSQEIVVILIGLLSAIIDNVPLVAAVMGMYTEPLDAELWHFIAFSAGTGGSILIIGSAAGAARRWV